MEFFIGNSSEWNSDNNNKNVDNVNDNDDDDDDDSHWINILHSINECDSIALGIEDKRQTNMKMCMNWIWERSATVQTPKTKTRQKTSNKTNKK